MAPPRRGFEPRFALTSETAVNGGGARTTAMPREATSSDRGQLAGLDRPHEHVPLGWRELHQVARLADADLVLVDLDARARVAGGAERDVLRHRSSPPFR